MTDTRFFTLPNGAKLAYAEFGDLSGKPMFYFHGSPGSRLEGRLFEQAAKQKGLRLIAPERPGMGSSNFQPGITWLEQADQIGLLADNLGLGQFAVMGYSGGGTLAQTCAYVLSDRVTNAILVGSWAPISGNPDLFELLAPLDKFFYRVGKNTPALFNLPFYMFLFAARHLSTKGFLDSFKSSMSTVDWEMAQEEGFGAFLQEDLVAAFSQGVRGPGYDALIQYADWGFKISEIKAPVHILHGTEDKFAPYPFAEYLHQQIPGSQLHTYPGDGHFAIHHRVAEV
ncbi:MAG: alpha/beta fold hydrolase, partial [Anaerolineales bacterium]